MSTRCQQIQTFSPPTPSDVSKYRLFLPLHPLISSNTDFHSSFTLWCQHIQTFSPPTPSDVSCICYNCIYGSFYLEKVTFMNIFALISFQSILESFWWYLMAFKYHQFCFLKRMSLHYFKMETNIMFESFTLCNN